jgi:hypothetical protein
LARQGRRATAVGGRIIRPAARRHLAPSHGRQGSRSSLCRWQLPLPLVLLATFTTIDGAGIVGEYTSITMGADGLGLISYFDQTNVELEVAHCADTACMLR